MSSRDALKWVIVVFLVGVAVTSLVVARGLIAPLDGLLTSRVCNIRGDELSRDVIEYERSNRFGLVNRSRGWCLFGPVIELDENGDPIVDVEAAADPASDEAAANEAATADPASGDPASGDVAVESVDRLQLSLAEIEPGGLYRLGKAMGIILQLGAASLAVRILADPLLDRFVRRR